ncbi:MAG: DUF2585 domain-containing protein [Hyphomicrobiaceae bacterium]
MATFPASEHTGRIDWRPALVIVILTGVVLLAMGRTPICTCGYIKLWHGIVQSSENSQHITDWYTFSHVIHGFIFYGVLQWLWPQWSFTWKLAVATLVECAWEIVENTPWIINKYRETTIALDYFGDSVLNSLFDIGAMVIGFWLASRLPIWLTVTLAIAMELIVGWLIRDNLTLNVIMLRWPLEAIKEWQGAI